MTIIDTHAHLDQIENIEAVLNEAAEAGVEAVVAVGIDQSANQKNLKLKSQNLKLKMAVALGIHPEAVQREDIEIAFDFIKENLFQAVAIGEIGLDYWYPWAKKSDDAKARMRDVYRRQLEIAKAHDLPVIIHSRGAWRDCLEIAKGVGVTQANFHWYSGPLDVLDEILGRGFFISCTPSLAYSPQAQDAVKRAPIEQTLIETDSPVYFKDAGSEGGFRATPRDVFKTLQLYAALKGISEEAALGVLNQNARRYFRFEENG